MGWYDLYRQRTATPASTRPRTVYRPTFYQSPRERAASPSYNPRESGRSGGSFAGGGTAATMPRAVGPAPSTQPIVPERFDVSLSYDQYKPQPPQPIQSTQGDIVGSILGAMGSTAASLNPMNAIPWLMERTNEAAAKVAEDASSPLQGPASVLHGITQPFLDSFTVLSEHTAPVLDALPNAFRDNHLANRVTLYQEMLTGEEQDWGPLWMNLFEVNVPGPGNSDTNSQRFAWQRLQAEYRGTQDPTRRADLKTQMAELMDAVDLPDDVKRAVEHNPRLRGREEIDKVLDDVLTKTGIGRQWAYGRNGEDVIGATWQNLANPMLWYGVETIALTKGLGGAQGALMGTTSKALMAPRFGVVPEAVTSFQPGLVQGLTAAGRTTAAANVAGGVRAGSIAIKSAQRIQKYALMAGLGTQGLTTLLDSKARFEGDEEAIRWFEELNQPGDFSQNPSVQLVSGFSVNPFGVANDLRKGTLSIGNKVGNVVLGRTLGDKLLKTMDPGGVVDQLLVKMYRLDPSELDDFAGQYYGNEGERFEQTIGLAMDYVLDNMPSENRTILLAQHKGDSEGLMKALLSKHGDEVYDALVSHQDELAQRFNRYAWEYHEYPGQFNRDVAALNARDMRLAKMRTFEFRQNVDAAVGYAEYLQPEAAVRAREFVTANAVDGALPVEGVGGLQDLIRMFPSLRKLWQDKGVTGGRVTTEQAEAMIRQAEDIYTHELKKNPLRAQTGIDPVLRPNAPAPVVAKALGTDVGTYYAIMDAPNPQNHDVILAFLKEKTGLTDAEAATLDPADALVRAQDYVEKATEPWYAAGKDLVTVEKTVARINERLRVLHAIEPNQRTVQQQERIVALQRQVNDLEAQRVPLEKAARAERRSGSVMEMAERAAARKAKVEAIAAEPPRPREFQTLAGGRVLVTEDVARPSGWRVSKLDANGDPVGHIEAPDYAAAIREAANERLVEIDGPNLKDTLDGDAIRPGMEAESQAANVDVGAAKGGTRESGGAMKGPAQSALDAHDALLRPVRKELADLERISPGRRTDADVAEMTELERQLEALTETLNRANDEFAQPFATQVETTRGVAEMADRIREMNPATMTNADRSFVTEYLATQADMVYNPTLPVEELLAVAKEHANTYVAAQTGHAIDMAERAYGIVTARRILEDISMVDDEVANLSGNIDGIGGLVGLFRRVEGNWSWAGGMPAATRGLRNDIVRVLNRPATEGAFTPGVRLQSQARSVPTMSDADVWRLLADNPDLEKALGRRYRTVIENVRAAHDGSIRPSSPDDYIPKEYAGRPGMGATDAWLEEAVELIQRYTTLLDEADVRLVRGDRASIRDMGVLTRRAGRTDVPPVYLEEAQQAIRDGVNPDPRRIVQERNALIELERAINTEGMPWEGIASAIQALPSRVWSKVIREMGESAGGFFDLSIEERIDVIRRTLFPDGTERPATFGPETQIDDAIAAGDADLVQSRSAEFLAAADRSSPPIRSTAAAARAMPTRRPSYEWRTRFRDFGISTQAAPDASVMASPGNRNGLEVLSILNHGVLGTQPKTVRRVVDLMRLIEDGTATRMGIGVPFQAEAMRVAEDILHAHMVNGKRLQIEPGVLEGGLDEAMLALDDFNMAKAMGDAVEMPDMPIGAAPYEALGTLQYGFKKRPPREVLVELQQFPGMAEEWLTGRFQTVQERVWTHQLRRGYDYVFGPYSNRAIAGAVRQRFVERAARAGVDPKVAGKIWNRWQEMADNSRGWEFRKDPKTADVEMLHGDSPLYAGVRNLPNNDMRGIAYQVIEDEVNRSMNLGRARELQRVPFDELFREAESFTRRTLKDRAPLGDELARAYGAVAHNKAVTTLYYWFRFGLDIRYHAMNFFESQILYLGRAGFKKGEIDQGLMGMSEGLLRKTDMDVANNTGYAMSRSRFSYAYRTFLKEQPDALRGTLKRLKADNPALMEKALREMAEYDPQLRDMLDEFGETPEGYMRAMDEWHGKMLKSIDEIEDGKTIDDALAEAMKESPALNEVYSALATANKETWANVRKTFMGNPDRSRIERLMNSYLLFWPISYQIKATRWMLRVMFDKMGGLPTNAGGAVMLGKLTESHRTLMENDAQYREWYEQHPTLVFIAQSLMPITPNSMGVSMSPVLRNLIPGGPTKALWDIGPIWTVNHIVRPMAGEVGADIYPTLSSLPGGQEAFGALTGQGLDNYRPKYWGD